MRPFKSSNKTEMDVMEHDNKDVEIKADPNKNSAACPAALPPDVPFREAYTRELKRDPETGKFVKGTGSRGYLGGRPVGSKDKVTRLMVDLARDVVAEHGQEMFDHLARTDPAACLALVTRLLPASDVSKALEDESRGSDQPVTVTINLTPAHPQAQLEHDKVERVGLTTDDTGWIQGVVEGRTSVSTERAKDFPPIDMSAPVPIGERPTQPRTDGGYKRGGSASDSIDHLDDNVV